MTHNVTMMMMTPSRFKCGRVYLFSFFICYTQGPQFTFIIVVFNICRTQLRLVDDRTGPHKTGFVRFQSGFMYFLNKKKPVAVPVQEKGAQKPDLTGPLNASSKEIM
jgi:hypothetical protein